jgi:hypothetical protein
VVREKEAPPDRLLLLFSHILTRCFILAPCAAAAAEEEEESPCSKTYIETSLEGDGSRLILEDDPVEK